MSANDFTEEQKELIIKSYQDGWQITKIALLLKVQRHNIYTFLKTQEIFIADQQKKKNGHRKCRICDEWKLLEDFPIKNKLYKKPQAECKVCTKVINRQYRVNNWEATLERNRVYRKNNPEKVASWERRSRIKKQLNDPHHSIRNRFTNRVKNHLLMNNESKSGKSIDVLLPHTMQEYIYHIESCFLLPGNGWMNWNNHGSYNPKTWDDNDPSTWTWQIDHIVPLYYFRWSSPEYKEKLFSEAWALDNISPLSSKINVSLGNKSKIVKNIIEQRLLLEEIFARYGVRA